MSKRNRKKLNKNNSVGNIQSDIKQAALNLIAKSFPNGDPNFFIPGYQKSTDTEEAVKKPYGNNVWVYSAVTGIVNNLLQLPKVLVDTSKKENEVITEHPILTLLEKPNPLMDGPTFWENIVLDLMLITKSTKGGQCFLLAEATNGGAVNLEKGEIPGEMYPFTDEFITAVVEKDTNILMGWKFKPGNSDKAILYKPEELIRIYLVDPDNPTKGQAPIYAGRRSLSQEAKAVALNENFFDNNAALGGLLTTDAELEKKVATEIRDSFESTHAGQENAGRTAVLHSGIKYEAFTKSHSEMQFMDQRKWGREEVLALYRVPKFVVSVYEDLNFATSKEANKAFWMQTLIPLDNRMVRGINSQWIRYIDKGHLTLKSDESKVPALQPDFTELLKQAGEMWKLQIPVAEINRRLDLGLETKQYPWLETWLTNWNLVPAEDVVNGTGDPNATEEEKPKEDEKGFNTLIHKIENLSKQKASNEKIRDSYTQSVLIPDEKGFKRMLGIYFKEQRNQILDKVDSWANSKDIGESEKVKKISMLFFSIIEHEKAYMEFYGVMPKYKSVTGDLMPSKAEENKRLKKKTKPLYDDMAEGEGAIVTAELGSLEVWNLNSPRMQKLIARRLKQIQGINTTTFRIARDHIAIATEQAVNEGLGVKETAKLIKKEVNKVYSGRIKTPTIARTEVSSIHSQTRNDIYVTEGIKRIRWITSGMDNVRSAKSKADFPHDVLNGEETKIDDGYHNGEAIKYPNDPDASASNVINCNCVHIAVKEK